MKKLSSYRTALLMSAVALSVLSSPASAVSEDVVKAYWSEISADERYLKTDVLTKLKGLEENQWHQFKKLGQALVTQDMSGFGRGLLISTLSNIDPIILFHKEFPKFIENFLQIIFYESSKAQILRIVGGYKEIFEKDFSYYSVFQSLGNEKALQDNGLIKAFSRYSEEQSNHPQLWETINSVRGTSSDYDEGIKNTFQTVNALKDLHVERWGGFAERVTVFMDSLKGLPRALCINCLKRIPDEITNEYISTIDILVKSFDKTRFYSLYLGVVAEVLSYAGSDKLTYPRFLPMVQTLAKGMDSRSCIDLLGVLREMNFQTLTHPKFFPTVQALTADIKGPLDVKVIKALGELDFIILSHKEFSSGMVAFLQLFGLYSRADIIEEIAKHRQIFQSQKFSYHALFQELKNLRFPWGTSSLLEALSEVPQKTIDNPNFFKIVQALAGDSGGPQDVKIIKALGKLDPIILSHKEFLRGIVAFLHMIHYHFRASAIEEIAKHRHIFQAQSFSYYVLFQELKNLSYPWGRIYCLEALSEVPQETIDNPNFLKTVHVLTKNMSEWYCAQSINILGEVPPGKLKHLYSQIQSLMKMTDNKNDNGARLFVQKLQNCNSSKEIFTFIDQLVALVKKQGGIVCDESFSNHINTAWNYMIEVYRNDRFNQPDVYQPAREKVVRNRVLEAVPIELAPIEAVPIEPTQDKVHNPHPATDDLNALPAADDHNILPAKDDDLNALPKGLSDYIKEVVKREVDRALKEALANFNSTNANFGRNLSDEASDEGVRGSIQALPQDHPSKPLSLMSQSTQGSKEKTEIEQNTYRGLVSSSLMEREE